MTLLQQAAPDSFWPSNLNGWVSLVTGVLVIMGAMGGLMSWWLRTKLNGLGRRVKLSEEGCTKNAADIQQLTQKQQTFEFAVGALSKDVGEIKAKIDDVRTTQAERFLAMESDARRWIEKLARIESKLGIPGNHGEGD